MYYTERMQLKTEIISRRAIICLLIFILASCSGGTVPQATPTAGAEPTSRPPVSNRSDPTSLPDVCNCFLRFDQIGIDQGLSQSTVRTILQDSRGFLWFGTEDGLNRYDGYTFTIFKPDINVPESLSDRWITSLAEDSNGDIWIGTRQGGLNRFNYKTGQFTRFQHSSADPDSLSNNNTNTLFVDQQNNLWIGTIDGLDLLNPDRQTFSHFSYDPDIENSISGRNVTAIFQDAMGNYWIGTAYSGLNAFDPKTGVFNSYIHDPNNDLTISNNRITSISQDANNVLWIGTQSGLNKLDPITGTFTRVLKDPENPYSLAGNNITSLYSDRSGNLWVGTSDGLDRMNKFETKFTHYTSVPSYLKSLSNNYILSIYEDRGGVLWFGTFGGGVNKYDRERDKFAYYRTEPENPYSLSSNFVFSILPTENDSAWIGTYGAGLNRFNRGTGEVIRFDYNPNDPYGLSSAVILSLMEDHEGMIWIGTGSNGLDKYNPADGTFTHFRSNPVEQDTLSGHIIYSIYEDSQDNVWVGTNIGLDRFNRNTEEFVHYIPSPGDPRVFNNSNRVDAIFEDRDGYLWVGTFDNGIYKFDADRQQPKRYRFNINNKQSISNDSILSIYQDSKGRIWIGTAGGGLNLYHPDTDSFTYYLEKDGLPNGVVYGILEDDNGYLWLSTNFGVSRFDPETQSFRNYDVGDGLQSNEFNMGAYAKSTSGEFYFGGIEGLTVFDPMMITDNPRVPQVSLTSLSLDGAPLETESTAETARDFTLDWPRDSFEFEFSALSYNQPHKNQYAYMLQGFDNNWNYIGTKHNGRYTNLPGGTFTLLLKATNSDGVWNQSPMRINVTVIPPFWETTWFGILLTVFLVSAVLTGIRVRTRSIQDRNRQLERLVRERTSALEKRNQEMQALYEADERILRNVSLNQVFQTLVDVAVDMLKADRSVVFSWDEKQTKVIPRVSHGFSAESLEVMAFAKGEGFVGDVLKSGKAAIVRHVDPNEFREDIRNMLSMEGIRSFAHLPIVVDHKVIGVFNVGFTRTNLLGDDAMRLFSALAQRASISIANMQLFEQTKDLAVMEERNRLARELHDSAKQKAFAALAQLGTARGRLNGNGDSVTIHLNEAENLVSDVIQELTFLVQEIYPIALQEKGLPATLREYVYEWENRNGIKVSLSIHKESRLPLGIEQALYRVAQETLANIARHSNAQRVDISLMYNGGTMQLSVSDDGCGFDMKIKGHGLGLRSIRERVSSVRGTLQIQSAPGQGTRILVQVPTKE